MRETEEETRPWGCFTVLLEGDGFKVKSISVQPGRRLSLQSHKRRAERWVVVRGRPKVTLDGVEVEHHPGDVIRIARGQKHRLENPASEMVVMIEVQIGDYLGEDDIVRYEDDYGRQG